jgi:hypothetical protein
MEASAEVALKVIESIRKILEADIQTTFPSFRLDECSVTLSDQMLLDARARYKPAKMKDRKTTPTGYTLAYLDLWGENIATLAEEALALVADPLDGKHPVNLLWKVGLSSVFLLF